MTTTPLPLYDVVYSQQPVHERMHRSRNDRPTEIAAALEAKQD